MSGSMNPGFTLLVLFRILCAGLIRLMAQGTSRLSFCFEAIMFRGGKEVKEAVCGGWSQVGAPSRTILKGAGAFAASLREPMNHPG